MKTAEEGKRERTPFSANRRRLQVDEKEKGYYYRWFNDTQDRLQRALDAGYEFVQRKDVGKVGDKDVSNTKGLDSRVSRVVGETSTRTPIWAFLMRIPDALHNEDVAVKAKQNDRVDEALSAGRASGSDVENRYGDVKVSRK